MPKKAAANRSAQATKAAPAKAIPDAEGQLSLLPPAPEPRVDCSITINFRGVPFSAVQNVAQTLQQLQPTLQLGSVGEHSDDGQVYSDEVLELPPAATAPSAKPAPKPVVKQAPAAPAAETPPDDEVAADPEAEPEEAADEPVAEGSGSEPGIPDEVKAIWSQQFAGFCWLGDESDDFAQYNRWLALKKPIESVPLNTALCNNPFDVVMDDGVQISIDIFNDESGPQVHASAHDPESGESDVYDCDVLVAKHVFTLGDRTYLVFVSPEAPTLADTTEPEEAEA